MSIERIERELRGALERASSGQWSAIELNDPQWGIKGAGEFEFIATTTQDNDENNARYIVAAQPENILALLDELSRLREVERRAKTVCESHDRASVKELPAGGTYFSIPAKELNDLTHAVTDLRRALSEREGQE